MKDNDIIKALECCHSKGNCDGCPLYMSRFEMEVGCIEIIIQSALDLINRQKTQILELQGNLKFVRGAFDSACGQLLETIGKQQAEIDAFSKEMKGEHHETVEDSTDL